jgi:hypothetical protein
MHDKGVKNIATAMANKFTFSGQTRLAKKILIEYALVKEEITTNRFIFVAPFWIL